MSLFRRIASFVRPAPETGPINLPSNHEAVSSRLIASGIEPDLDVVDYIVSAFPKMARDVMKDPEFIAISQKWGRGSPKDAWFEVVKPCNSVLACVRDLRDANEAGIEIVKLRFGGTLAGHCRFSRHADGMVVSMRDAPLLPPAECEHPDQCGCRWQSWISLMDEIE